MDKLEFPAVKIEGLGTLALVSVRDMSVKYIFKIAEDSQTFLYQNIFTRLKICGLTKLDTWTYDLGVYFLILTELYSPLKSPLGDDFYLKRMKYVKEQYPKRLNEMLERENMQANEANKKPSWIFI